MICTIVVAASENNVIGIANQLPWHLPVDLKFFKKTTLEKPILMGRKTFESLGKPLPKRLNIVLSRKRMILPAGVLHFENEQKALDFLKEKDTTEVCIIGGGVVFKDALEYADQIFLTRVHTQIENGEVFFPVLDLNIWEQVWEEYHPKDEQHLYDFTFEQYKRKIV